MKKMLALPAFLFCGTALYAQETTVNLPRLQERVQSFMIRGGDTLLFRRPPELVRVPRYNVASLPQDGMPCIVPDTRSVAAIPNPWNVLKTPVEVGQIPNPARKNRKEMGK